MFLDALDTKFLREFSAVAQSGSIRRAAENMNIVPSAISRKISDVELRLGVRLFERRSNGVVLTDAGTLMLKHAQQLHDEQNFLLDQLNNYREGSVRPIRIAVCESFLQDLMENGLPGIMSHAPRLNITIQQLSSLEVQTAIAQGEADIGISYGTDGSRETKVVAETCQPLCAVVPADSPLTLRNQINFTDVLDLPLALPDQRHVTREIIGNIANDIGIALNPMVETNSIAALVHFASAGLGATFLPRCSASLPAMHGLIAAVDVAELCCKKTNACIIVKSRCRLPKATNIAANVLASEMAVFSTAN